MKKAWIDFKTDEQTFKIIMQYEEGFVQNIVEKKYSRFYITEEVKKNLTKKEEERFTLASLLIELDVLCANKLKEQNRDLLEFFSKSENLMLRKLCLATGFDVSKIDSIISKFPKEQRYMLIYLFGINRKKMKLQDAEKFFDNTTDEIYKNLLDAVRRLKWDIKITKENRNTAEQIPTAIIINLEGKGYTRSEIIEALNLYDDNTKYVLQRYYGHDYSSVKSPLTPVLPGDAEIINKVLTGEDNVGIKIKKIREERALRVKKAKEKNTAKSTQEKPLDLLGFYKNQRYSTYNIKKAYQSLSDGEKAFIRKQYDENLKELKGVELTEEEQKIIFNLTRSETQGLGKALKDMYRKPSTQTTNIIEEPVRNNLNKINPNPASKKTPVKTSKPQNSLSIQINDYETLNEYYKQFGFDDDDLEILYQNTNSTDKKMFNKYIDVVETTENRHVFNIKNEISTEDERVIRYFSITILRKLGVFRKLSEKPVDNPNIPSWLKEILNHYGIPKTHSSSKKHTTLAEFYGHSNFDNNSLESSCSNLNDKEEKTSEKHTDVTEDENRKQISAMKNSVSKSVESVENPIKNEQKQDVLTKENSPKDKNNKSGNFQSINAYTTLNDYYKQFGFDDEDLELFYKSTTVAGKRKFSEYINIVKTDENKYIFYIKTPIPISNQSANNYFYSAALRTMGSHRVAAKKTIDELKTPKWIENKIKEYSVPKGRNLIENCSTLNDFYKNCGFDDDTIETLYSNCNSDERKLFQEYIEVIETEDGKHIFRIKKVIIAGDRTAYRYFAKYAIRKLKEYQKNAVEEFKVGSTLNDYYKRRGFDDEDLESVYQNLHSFGVRYFEKYIDVECTENNTHIFKIKEKISRTGENKDQQAVSYFRYKLLTSLVRYRIDHGKEIDRDKIPQSVLDVFKNRSHKEKTPYVVLIDENTTLNEYYEARGFDSTKLEEVYLKTNRGKDYFDEYIDIIKTDDGKVIFKVKKPIKRKKDTAAYNYFVRSLPYRLTRKRTMNKSISSKTTEPTEPPLLIENSESINNNVKRTEIDPELLADLKDYVGEYITSVKETNIITRELITNLGLPKRYEYFLLNEFVANKDNKVSLDEEAEILNLDVMELCKILIEAIELLKSEINNKLMINNPEINQTPETNDGETNLKKALN